MSSGIFVGFEMTNEIISNMMEQPYVLNIDYIVEEFVMCFTEYLKTEPKKGRTRDYAEIYNTISKQKNNLANYARHIIKDLKKHERIFFNVDGLYKIFQKFTDNGYNYDPYYAKSIVKHNNVDYTFGIHELDKGCNVVGFRIPDHGCVNAFDINKMIANFKFLENEFYKLFLEHFGINVKNGVVCGGEGHFSIEKKPKFLFITDFVA